MDEEAQEQAARRRRRILIGILLVVVAIIPAVVLTAIGTDTDKCKEIPNPAPAGVYSRGDARVKARIAGELVVCDGFQGFTRTEVLRRLGPPSRVSGADLLYAIPLLPQEKKRQTLIFTLDKTQRVQQTKVDVAGSALP